MLSIKKGQSALKIVFLFFLTGISFPGFSQGEFLHRGTSGYGLNGSFQGGQSLVNVYKVKYTGAGLSMGFSIKGIVDLQAGSLTQYIAADEYYAGSDKDVGSNAYGKVVIHAVKQTDKIPASVRGSFTYSYSDYADANTTLKDMRFSIGSYRRMYLADKISFIPSIDFVYSRFKFTPSGSSLVLEGKDFYTDVSIPVAFNFARSHILYLTPGVAMASKGSGSYFWITLGYMSPMYIRQK